jgi:GntR family transcriptional regulator
MAAAAYARIASDLRRKITSRDIKPGGHLPSELELRDQYQASRNTVLDAIKMLKDEGLVETRPGQGWFAKIRIVPFVNSIDWEDDTAIAEARARGRVPQAMPPTVNKESAPAGIADRLDVPVGTEMIVRRQEWLLDGLPWKLQVVWCPKIRSDEGAHRLLVAEDISEGVGRYLYSALGLVPAGAKFYFLPRKPSDEEIRFFGFPDESDVPYVIELIRTATVAADSDPRPLYAAVGVYAGDRNRFESSRSAPPSDRPAVTPNGTR